MSTFYPTPNESGDITSQEQDDGLGPGLKEKDEEHTMPPPRWLNIEERGWRKLVQNFTPSWFSINMGTGIVSILLHALPYSGSSGVLHTLSIVIFILNVLLFCLIFGMDVVRYILYPKTWTLMIRHPVQSLFLGTLPMGFATIITMGALVCAPKWGGAWPDILWALWWIDAAVSIAVCMGLPFAMMYLHSTSLSSMTAVWLLPVVAPIVASATGGTMASILPPEHALWTIIVSYVLWGIGFPMAMVVLVIYFHRLAMHNLPPREMIVSVFLPLGPLGQGGYALMALGKVSMEIFPKTNSLHPMAGDVLYIVGFVVAVILWGFGLTWLFFAVASISRSKFPFNMGWWGFTFPIGVFAMSTLTIGAELSSHFFKVLGTIIAVCVMVLWLVVALNTSKAAISGKLFFAPCLHGVHNTCPKKADENSKV